MFQKKWQRKVSEKEIIPEKLLRSSSEKEAVKNFLGNLLSFLQKMMKKSLWKRNNPRKNAEKCFWERSCEIFLSPGENDKEKFTRKKQPLKNAEKLFWERSCEKLYEKETTPEKCWETFLRKKLWKTFWETFCHFWWRKVSEKEIIPEKMLRNISEKEVARNVPEKL